MVLRKFLFGVVLCALASSAAALTLGASHGVVVLGSPVDLAFDLRLDSRQEPGSLCLTARVAAGDSPIPERQVRITTSAPVRAGVARVRVRADVPVNEPVLTVTLFAGCGGQVSRAYTFLVDFPVTPTGALAVAEPQALDLPQSRGNTAATPFLRASSAGAARVSRVAADRARRSASKAPRRRMHVRNAPERRVMAATAVSAAATQRGSKGTASPKLVVEPLESVSGVAAPGPRPEGHEAPQLPAAPVDGAARQDAVAQGSTTSVSTEELLQLRAREHEHEAQLRQLQAQLEKEQQEAQALRQRVAQAESDRFSAVVTYSLAGLLLLALLGLFWVRRGRDERTTDWRVPAMTGMRDEDAEAVAPAASGVSPALTDGALDFDSLRATDVAGAPTLPMQYTSTDHALGNVGVAGHPGPGAAADLAAADEPAARARHIEHPEQLFDVLQQAEFFISIGEHEQAVGALRKHIAQHPDSSPLAHLELLRLYHALGRVEAFDEVSGHFHERFNAQVPAFAAFHEQGRSLEDYPDALERIEALWPSAEVVGLLDEFMFRQPGVEPVARFDLPAFEDLLLLLAVAQTTAAHERGSLASRVRAQRPPAADTGGMRAFVRAVGDLAGDLALEPLGHAPAGSAAKSLLDVDLSLPPEGGVSSSRVPMDAAGPPRLVPPTEGEVSQGGPHPAG